VLYSVLYYSEQFGEPPFRKMSAAEIPYGHGQAFPAFLHLAWSVFENADNTGGSESFVAHEVAHQWWGGALAWSNYHEQWISEAFSEYSSLLYMRAILKDNKRFYRKLSTYRERIINKRKSFLGDGVECGPIWLGWRVGSGWDNYGDYQTLIYEKGAWVLHMLRSMMIDLSTFDDKPFMELLKDFYQTFKGKDPTTEDFQAIVEKHVGQKMDWFFQQWIYGNKIPKYKISYKVVPGASGKYKVAMRIRQQNVPKEFNMVVPFSVKYKDDLSSPFRVVVNGEATEFTLPELPYEPEKIDFNIYDSVLCEWQEVDWDDNK
jgi:aminopeptidase N